MGRIHVLDDATINRIAAGEVVERPASVVKELIENSLDAGAKRVEVRVEAGGKRRIVVDDDGHGMGRDDVLLALERHATSKLDDRAELSEIRSLGFRGEALPSIAAVSRFRLGSALEGGAGHEVEVRGGRIIAVREVARPRGTTVEAASLFFNVPARRKFLRADATELTHVTRVVTRVALAHPGVHFLLDSGGRTIVDAPPVEQPAARLAGLFGHGTAERLTPFDGQGVGHRVHGFAGRPAEATTRRDGQHLFVNGRPVQDRMLAHAVREAYAHTVPKERFPSLFLFVEVDPALVDVNVHPQKSEVRFARGREVHDLVREAVHSALRGPAVTPSYGELRPVSLPPSETVAESVESYQPAPEPIAAAAVAPPPPEPPAPLPFEPAAAVDAGHPAWRPVFQFRDSYIVARDGEDLVFVDQHAAHERVLFEAYLAAAERDRVQIQRLVFPLTVELSAPEQLAFEAEAGEFRRLGFLVEAFGGETVRIDGVPAVTGHLDPETLFRELLGEAAQARSARADLGDVRHRLVTTAACHAAIKVNHPLAAGEMARLLEDLARVGNPSTCPHGRPVSFRLTLEEIERAFRRR